MMRHRWAARPMSLLAATGLATAGLLVVAVLHCADAGEIRVRGSTTFNRMLLQPFRDLIETASKQSLNVIANRSGLGLLDLAEGRADVAMISAPLKDEVATLRKAHPKLSFDNFQAFEVSKTSVALLKHASNPVSEMTSTDLRKVLKGEIRNWSGLGGPSMPIRVTLVRAGGVAQAVAHQVLGGEDIAAQDEIPVYSSTQVVKVAAQEPGALGLAQLRLARDTGAHQIKLDQTISQVLSLVTNGAPSPNVDALIRAARDIAEKHLASASD